MTKCYTVREQKITSWQYLFKGWLNGLCKFRNVWMGFYIKYKGYKIRVQVVSLRPACLRLAMASIINLNRWNQCFCFFWVAYPIFKKGKLCLQTEAQRSCVIKQVRRGTEGKREWLSVTESHNCQEHSKFEPWVVVRIIHTDHLQLLITVYVGLDICTLKEWPIWTMVLINPLSSDCE